MIKLSAFAEIFIYFTAVHLVSVFEDRHMHRHHEHYIIVKTYFMLQIFT